MVGAGKKTRQTEKKKKKKEVGRQHQGLDRPGLRKVPESSGEQRKMEETGCEFVCGTPAIPAVKGLVKEGRKIRIAMHSSLLCVWVVQKQELRSPVQRTQRCQRFSH